MKLKITLLAALAAFTIVDPVSAAVLFTDNFDANSNTSPNDQLTNPGRQGGTLATLGYIVDGNAQIGNTSGAIPPNLPNSGLGDDLLTAFTGRAYVNYNFSDVTQPLEITFSGLVRDAGDATFWVSISIADNTAPFVNSSGANSILFRANGGTELLANGAGTSGVSGSAFGLNVWSGFKVVLSDTAGTGSAWGTGGSRADYYSNGTLLGTFTMTQLTASQGYIGFSTSDISGYDDLQIQTIPEPSAFLLVGLGMFAMMARRRRSQA